MLHRLHRSNFLRPRERLYELLALSQADSRQGLTTDSSSEATLDQRTLAAYVAELSERGLVERWSDGQERRFGITPSGQKRLHVLVVDLARELAGLNDAARELLRRNFVPLALDGVRRVAFYPFGETAEVAFDAMNGLGFDLVAIVDDSMDKQGLPFHGHRVEAPAVLRDRKPEAVIVTTAVFQDLITERIRAMQMANVRIHTL